MNATPAKRYLTNNESAAYLGLGRQTLPKLRLRGTGPVFRKFGRSVRYAVEDLDVWAQGHRRRSKLVRHRSTVEAGADCNRSVAGAVSGGHLTSGHPVAFPTSRN
jgi:predicted DNA-binding transcriptional regulator AlpA